MSAKDSEVLAGLLFDLENYDADRFEPFPVELAALTRAAALARLLEGGTHVMVPREAAKMVSDVCSEWIDLFRDAPGLDKYERYSYEPAVEELRDEFSMLAAAAPTFDPQPQQGA